MIYGPFSLEGATDAELRYQAWLNVHAADRDPDSGTEYDGLCHMASIDGVYFAGTCTTSEFPQKTWTEVVFSLRDVEELGNLTGKEQIWIMLAFRSGLFDSTLEGVYVDDVLLQKYAGTDRALSESQISRPRAATWYEPASFTRGN
jgi:hypothetical protein